MDIFVYFAMTFITDYELIRLLKI